MTDMLVHSRTILIFMTVHHVLVNLLLVCQLTQDDNLRINRLIAITMKYIVVTSFV